MKNNRLLTENLSEQLGQIDDDLLNEAYMTDSPDKLKQLTSIEKNHHSFFLSSSTARRTIAACVCLLVAMIVTLALFMLSKRSTDPMGDMESTAAVTDTENSSTISPDSPPAHQIETQQFHESIGGLPAPEDKVTLDSLDKINYYAAMKMLHEAENASEFPLQTPLAVSFVGSTSESIDEEPWESYIEEDETDYTRVIGSMDISYKEFCITMAVYFSIQVDEDTAYLPDKIGTGTVEVVITDLWIGRNPRSPWPMITFKNGDRYFSCLAHNGNGLTDGENGFWTHQYIKGYELFKDTTQDFGWFKVMFNEETQAIDSISYIPYARIPSKAPVYPISLIPDTTIVTYQTYEFTFGELEAYYNGEYDIPAVETAWTDEYVPPDGYVREEGTVIWDAAWEE